MNKSLSRKQFDILKYLEGESGGVTQRKLSNLTGMSLGSVNNTLASLNELGYVDNYSVTASGLEALSPYKVKRAVFIAAGFGARLAPITLNTPKPLVRVNGVRIIDTLIDAVLAAGINEIVIVRGYLGEQFDQLLYKYPNIKFIENPDFNECNNISSAMCARYCLQNAYVLDADLIIKNPGLINRYEYRSNLLGVPVERTDDWCITADRNGYAENIAMGGISGYREVGIFYLDSDDGSKMVEDLQSVYQSPGGRERLWEQVPLAYKKDNYKIEIRECSSDDFSEVDTLRDLRKIDPAYKF
ncbi:MAG: sugar phosphate nucleotidyltransferase [Candidatus Limivicinus sp.]|jgi:CTP:phosphocholine cytidylyltransferase-like protein